MLAAYRGEVAPPQWHLMLMDAVQPFLECPGAHLPGVTKTGPRQSIGRSERECPKLCSSYPDFWWIDHADVPLILGRPSEDYQGSYVSMGSRTNLQVLSAAERHITLPELDPMTLWPEGDGR